MAKSPYISAISTFLIFVLSSAELLSLTWDEVDFMRGSIQVRAGYAKNGESRSIPMNEVLTSTLEAIRISDGAVLRNRKETSYRSVRTAFAECGEAD